MTLDINSYVSHSMLVLLWFCHILGYKFVQDHALHIGFGVLLILNQCREPHHLNNISSKPKDQLKSLKPNSWHKNLVFQNLPGIFKILPR